LVYQSSAPIFPEEKTLKDAYVQVYRLNHQPLYAEVVTTEEFYPTGDVNDPENPIRKIG
jgi:hypothetical protein